ncbi:hypothetical protein [Microvirga puerhi]|uniref:Uncharacterized protein n=1 Tax=Microvirga puerhi TaxID=2876078 RepID=A0ABS7VK66_9HYPH|nr:hypothetical protein [Microvirga puerhi]MBZ6075397.1 hypothetical protein [Microvirga puerhi]
MASTMPDDETHVTFSSLDYDAIEAAVLETARGRWFLREYAGRNRNADTEAVLAAIAGLEKKMADDKIARTMEQIRSSLLDMAGAIEDTRAEIAPPEAASVTSVLAASGEAQTSQRIARILETLRFLEGRIRTMMALVEPEGTEGPSPAPGADFARSDMRPSLLN